MTAQIVNVRLYGALGTRFGRLHRLAVASTAEAVRALCVLLPGFEREMMTSKDCGVTYAVFAGKRNLVKQQLHDPLNGADVRIAPILQGSKAAGLFQTLLGAVITVVSIWAPALAPLGISMMLGGVSQLLSPQQKGLSTADSPDNGASYNYNGPINTEAQGNPVQLCYGRMIVGSGVGSVGIYAEDQQ